MNVLCKCNDPDDLSKKIPNNFNFGLQIDKNYMVMGIVIAEKQIWYLIDEKGKPNYYPFQLFEVTNTLVNPSWHFKVYREDDGIIPFDKEAVWGYYELVFESNHYEKLIEREEGALRTYFKRKIEMENSLR